jgi:hypothetical protein|tara:strand:- start:5639 stop:5794 length:156 start_codon:yes stop_codon:yes gene_type:complete
MFTTIAVERLLMDSRNKKLQESLLSYNRELRDDKNTILRKYIATKRRLKEK